MEQVISKSALKEVLLVADLAITSADGDTRKALDALWALCNSGEQDRLLLADLSDYEDHVLWEGANDVRNLIESGCYQEEFAGMTEEEQEALIAEVANRIDWSDVAAVGIEAGNGLISRELDEVFAEQNINTEAE